MIDIDIDTSAAETELSAISRNDFLQRPMELSLAYLLDHLANYAYMNLNTSRPPMQFRSPRQRRGFFAALRDGRIQVPYRRTGNLGRMWSKRITRSGDGVEGEVGSNARSRTGGQAYGPYVIGSETQAQYHYGRWRTDEDVADNLTPAIQGIFDRAISERTG